MESVRKTRGTLSFPTWISLRAAGALLRMSQVKAGRLVMAKTFGDYLVVGKHTYVDRRKIEAWLQKNERPAATFEDRERA